MRDTFATSGLNAPAMFDRAVNGPQAFNPPAGFRSLVDRQTSGFRPIVGRTPLERYRRIMDERGYQYAEDFFAYTVSVNNLAPGATAILPISIQRDSVFEWIATTGGAAATNATAITQLQPIDVTIIDSASSRNLMNNRIPLPNIAGDGRTPFILPTARRFMPSTQVTIVLHNYSAAITFQRVNFSLIGRKVYWNSIPGYHAPLPERFVMWRDEETGKLYSEDLYMYDFPVASSTHGTSSLVTNVIERDSDFEWIVTTMTAFNNTPAVVPAQSAFFTLQLLDGGSSQNLFANSTPGQTNPVIDAGDISGDGRFPFILPQARIFLSSSPVMLTFNNNDPANDWTQVHLTMIGRKIFELDD